VLIVCFIGTCHADQLQVSLVVRKFFIQSNSLLTVDVKYW